MKIATAAKRIPFYLAIGAFWLLIVTMDSFLNRPEIAVVHFFNETWLVLSIIAVNFIFFEYSLPLILRRRASLFFTILIGVLLMAVQLVLVSFGLYFWRSLGIAFDIYTPLRQMTLAPGGPYNLMMAEAIYQVESGIASLFFFGIIKQVYDYNKLLRVTQQLRSEKAEAELQYLKSQTNPHFLFNTLNNIYSLARDKSDQTAESILRLSKILRFMLYETSSATITITQEQELISDYIALEQLRYDSSLRVNFTFDIEDASQQLPPLLLIPLVENAFKHGASEASGASFIEITLSARQQRLSFVVKNAAEGLESQKVSKENIGLANLRRQLELLYTDYHLSTKHEESVFTAALHINLASHA
jgi:two-component system LytT family sensor kinase